MGAATPWMLLALLCFSPLVQGQGLQPAMGAPLSGLTPDELTRFFDGKVVFEEVKDVAGGLGPVFNDDSCAGCHSDPAVGGSGTTTVTRFGFLPKSGPFDPLASLGGSLLQSQSISISCEEVVPAVANIVINRVTTLTLGLGLIEAIPDADLLNLAAASTGEAHMVPLLENPLAPFKVGRFGWKAQIATVMSFSGDASLNEMGITNPIAAVENAPNGDAALLAACDTVLDPEEDQVYLDKLTDFQRFAAQPPQTPKSGMSGEQVFIDTGCADCHTAAAYVTGTTAEASLSGQSIKPYSDFLLHDMGSLGDGITQGDAHGLLMRTPPLWGLRFRDPLLHDGRSAAGTFPERVTSAIAFHGGTAFASAAAFAALPPADAAQLISFLDSLGRREFDFDGDNAVSVDDLAHFASCFTGSGAGTVMPDDPCAIHDVDQDLDVDIDDLNLLLTVYLGVLDDCDLDGAPDIVGILDGTTPDCDGNLIPDSCDIAGGAPDLNGNGVIDSCEVFIRGDCNSDGGVNIADVVRSLDFSFGGVLGLLCDAACDTNGDGGIDVSDAVYSLSFMFTLGPVPPAPYPDCGTDSTPAALDCAGFTACP